MMDTPQLFPPPSLQQLTAPFKGHIQHIPLHHIPQEIYRLSPQETKDWIEWLGRTAKARWMLWTLKGEEEYLPRTLWGWIWLRARQEAFSLQSKPDQRHIPLSIWDKEKQALTLSHTFHKEEKKALSDLLSFPLYQAQADLLHSPQESLSRSFQLALHLSLIHFTTPSPSPFDALPSLEQLSLKLLLEQATELLPHPPPNQSAPHHAFEHWVRALKIGWDAPSSNPSFLSFFQSPDALESFKTVFNQLTSHPFYKEVFQFFPLSQEEAFPYFQSQLNQLLQERFVEGCRIHSISLPSEKIPAVTSLDKQVHNLLHRFDQTSIAQWEHLREQHNRFKKDAFPSAPLSILTHRISRLENRLESYQELTQKVGRDRLDRLHEIETLQLFCDQQYAEYCAEKMLCDLLHAHPHRSRQEHEEALEKQILEDLNTIGSFYCNHLQEDPSGLEQKIHSLTTTMEQCASSQSVEERKKMLLTSHQEFRHLFHTHLSGLLPKHREEVSQGLRLVHSLLETLKAFSP